MAHLKGLKKNIHSSLEWTLFYASPYDAVCRDKIVFVSHNL